MTESIPTLTRHDLEAKIVKRCWEDEAFRKEFLADPAGAFTRYLEVPATSLPRIVVHKESAGSWHIVLPAKPGNIGELSERDLERVAAAGTEGWLRALTIVTEAGPIVLPAALSAGIIATGLISAEESKGW
jgi:hypothetical protein